jgi:predicted AlkP superfamily phosphohydrolase/phosphomutase
MRTFMFGLDGTSSRLIETRARQKHLWILQPSIHKGTWNRLTSVLPFSTSSAWTTSATGQPLHKHNFSMSFATET